MATDIDRTVVRAEVPVGAVIRLDDAVVLELFGDRAHPCGNGSWCDECREDIRAEAMLWLRELNGGRGRTEPTASAADADYRLLYRWSEHTMLADLPTDP